MNWMNRIIYSLARKRYSDRELMEKYAQKRAATLRRAYLYAPEYQKDRIAEYLSDLGGQKNYTFLYSQLQEEQTDYHEATLHIVLVAMCEKGHAKPSTTELQYLSNSVTQLRGRRSYEGAFNLADVSSHSGSRNRQDLIARHESARKSIDKLWSN